MEDNIAQFLIDKLKDSQAFLQDARSDNDYVYVVYRSKYLFSCAMPFRDVLLPLAQADLNENELARILVNCSMLQQLEARQYIRSYRDDIHLCDYIDLDNDINALVF
ncbi:hypothetical protein [Methylomonas sp. CM2]|uniref:hypothetical protein n=1 Tax=Methylomonas sp. CM2 TaxID=3417647 RepID=UPI003CFBA3FD